MYANVDMKAGGGVVHSAKHLMKQNVYKAASEYIYNEENPRSLVITQSSWKMLVRQSLLFPIQSN